MIDQPDISEANRITVILKQDGQWIRTFGTAAARLVFQFQVVVHDNSVVPNRNASLGNPL